MILVFLYKCGIAAPLPRNQGKSAATRKNTFGCDHSYNFTNSTLRFCALASAVLLSASGFVSPMPSVSIRESSMLNSLLSTDLTAADLLFESSRFFASSPSLSVCPMIFILISGFSERSAAICFKVP